MEVILVEFRQIRVKEEIFGIFVAGKRTDLYKVLCTTGILIVSRVLYQLTGGYLLK
jgi:hypothetical protein